MARHIQPRGDRIDRELHDRVGVHSAANSIRSQHTAAGYRIATEADAYAIGLGPQVVPSLLGAWRKLLGENLCGSALMDGLGQPMPRRLALAANRFALAAGSYPSAGHRGRDSHRAGATGRGPEPPRRTPRRPPSRSRNPPRTTTPASPWW